VSVQMVSLLLMLCSGLLCVATFLRKRIVARRTARVFSQLGAIADQVVSLGEKIGSLALAKQVSDAQGLKN